MIAYQGSKPMHKVPENTESPRKIAGANEKERAGVETGAEETIPIRRQRRHCTRTTGTNVNGKCTVVGTSLDSMLVGSAMKHRRFDLTFPACGKTGMMVRKGFSTHGGKIIKCEEFGK